MSRNKIVVSSSFIAKTTKILFQRFYRSKKWSHCLTLRTIDSATGTPKLGKFKSRISVRKITASQMTKILPYKSMIVFCHSQKMEFKIMLLLIKKMSTMKLKSLKSSIKIKAWTIIPLDVLCLTRWWASASHIPASYPLSSPKTLFRKIHTTLSQIWSSMQGL